MSPTRPVTPANGLTRSRSRRTIETFEHYAEAEAAVDRLSDRKFPVEHVAIVAHDLRFVERVTGRRDTGRAALASAGTGALLGAVLGAFFGLFNWVDPVVSALALALYGAALGAIVGAIVGMIGHLATRGRRDFSSVSAMEAGGYELVVDAELADEALRVLNRGDGPAPTGND